MQGKEIIGETMIDELKYMLDEAEGKSPVVKEVLLKVAALPENKQADMLQLIKIILDSKC